MFDKDVQSNKCIDQSKLQLLRQLEDAVLFDMADFQKFKPENLSTLYMESERMKMVGG